MASNPDPLERIAESLANLERLYADQLPRQEEQRKQFEERQKHFDEQQKKWDERQAKWDKASPFGNPWLQPRQIAHLLLAVALLILAIAVLALVRH